VCTPRATAPPGREGEAALIEQGLVMAFGQRVPTRLGVGDWVVHVEDRSNRLLLEPFACIALVEPRQYSQFGWCQRPSVSECSIEAEASPEVDAQHIHRGNRGLEQALDESITALRSVRLNSGHVWLPPHDPTA
jgi:hypothetical protein